MEDLTLFETPTLTTDVHDKPTTGHDAPAGADGDGAAPMVPGALLPEEGGITMKTTETPSDASAAGAKPPDADETNPMATMPVGERADRLRAALETRQLAVEPPVFDSVALIVSHLTSLRR